MVSSPSRRPGKRPAPPGAEGSEGDGFDRISSLPDDLLHLVLVRLGCAREAARSSVLARRWRGLWTRLPEYTFRDMELEVVETALAQVTRPALCRLDIKVELKSEAARGRASHLLRAAARLSPETVSVSLVNQVPGFGPGIDLPCFDHTSSLVLQMDGFPIASLPAGEFTRLESLDLTTESNIFTALLPCCPRLRILRIHGCSELKDVTVHSDTLEELELECVYTLVDFHGVDIDAPGLKKMKLEVEMNQEFIMKISAPNAEELSWKIDCIPDNIGFATHRLLSLNYSLSQGVRTLHLVIDDMYYDSPVPDKTFAQEIARLKVADFSVLELVIETNGHAFGPLLLHLLQIQPAIQRLKVVVDEGEEKDKEFCPRNCPCRQPVNWKSENIFLTNLEEALISYYRLKGGDDDVDFLELLFRCAPGLKQMGVVARDKVHKKLRNIYEKNPHVRCELSHC